MTNAVLSPHRHYRPTAVSGIDELIGTFEPRYNRGDPEGVAALYTADARWLSAAGPVFDGRLAIREALEGLMHSTPPRLTLTEQDRFVFGRRAVSRGTYDLSSVDGDEFGFRGAYLNFLRDDGDGWRIASQQMNYEFAMSPEMWTGRFEAVRALPTSSVTAGVADLCDQLTGSAPAFGDLLASDVCTSLPGRRWEIGRAPVADEVLRWTSGGSRFVFHDLSAWRLSERQTAHVVWYVVLRGARRSQWGTGTLVVQRQLDGTRRIRWFVATASPES